MKSGGEITAEVLASGSQRDKLPLLEQFSTDQLMQEIMRRYTLLQTEVADQFTSTGPFVHPDGHSTHACGSKPLDARLRTCVGNLPFRRRTI